MTAVSAFSAMRRGSRKPGSSCLCEASVSAARRCPRGSPSHGRGNRCDDALGSAFTVRRTAECVGLQRHQSLRVTAQVAQEAIRPCGCLPARGLGVQGLDTFQPCFLAVERTERMTAKSFAPSSKRNPPEIFWRSFIMRPSCSARLLVKGTSDRSGSASLPPGWRRNGAWARRYA